VDVVNKQDGPRAQRCQLLEEATHPLLKLTGEGGTWVCGAGVWRVTGVMMWRGVVEGGQQVTVSVCDGLCWQCLLFPILYTATLSNLPSQYA
jgi:hypothetical protein